MHRIQASPSFESILSKDKYKIEFEVMVYGGIVDSISLTIHIQHIYYVTIDLTRNGNHNFFNMLIDRLRVWKDDIVKSRVIVLKDDYVCLEIDCLGNTVYIRGMLVNGLGMRCNWLVHLEGPMNDIVDDILTKALRCKQTYKI